MDWSKLLARELKAPIKPKVKSPGDTKHIDGMFLDESIAHTPASEAYDMNLLNQLHFDNFTYNEERTLKITVHGSQTDQGMDLSNREILDDLYNEMQREDNSMAQGKDEDILRMGKGFKAGDLSTSYDDNL